MKKNKESDSFVYGIHAVSAVLHQQPERVHRLLFQSGMINPRIQELVELAQHHDIRVESFDKKTFERMMGNVSHQRVALNCEPLKTLQEQDIEKYLDNIQGDIFLLILDGVQDPHNLGACLRTADAAGVHMVIAPKDSSVGLTPAVKKVACGAAEILPFVQVTNLSRTMKMLKERNIWLYGTDDEAAQSIYQTNLKGGSLGLVMGSEGPGLRRLTKEDCDVLVSIPMYGSVPSLNVAVATGVCLFECVRQRG
jgi:23S rRNA (guanosine2251-2'-O)-methyltransferase